MKKFLLLIILLIFSTVGVLAQEFSVSGFVRDEDSGEPLIGATIYEPNLKLGTTTNQNGFYSLVLPSGRRKLEWSYVGYYTKVDSFYLGMDLSETIELQENYYLGEVVVAPDKENEIPDESSTPSGVSIPMKQIRSIPPVFGEVDLIKAVQMMPGVQTGLEGSSGLYVRGGTPDQNLILIDGVPVYNINHMFGFFSAFNVDAI
ncbi:MAG TPA: TonB-dependent receptor, partial [Bacteroidetes bacterium]|nr:TonB-dependent receptor [Bacteroidota bacterium]